MSDTPAVKVRTKPVYSAARQVKGLVEVVAGKAVNPGNWIVDMPGGAIVVPEQEFTKIFEIVPDFSRAEDPSGARAVAEICAKAVASEFMAGLDSGAISSLNLDPKHIEDAALNSIERFIAEMSSGDPAAAGPGEGASDMVMDAGPDVLQVAYTPDGRVVLSFPDPLPKFVMSNPMARAYATSIFNAANKAK